jgi:amino-acid N-acetyltransferase
VRLRDAEERDVAPLLALINGYADRGMLLRRTEESLRRALPDFVVVTVPSASGEEEIVGCAALSMLGPALGEVRSLAVRADHAGKGLGRRIVEHLLVLARERGFAEVLALTRRSSFFDALGFEITRRERFIDKLMVDCGACPLNLCCDEIAMVRPPAAPGEFAPPPQETAPAHKEL